MVKNNLEQNSQTSDSTAKASSMLKYSSSKISKPLKDKTAGSRKKRVLHVAGSVISKYYECTSFIYGIPSFVHGPREEFEHIFAKVSNDNETGEIIWQFNDDVPEDEEKARVKAEKAEKLSSDEAITHIMKSIKADVVVPHMFCYPGYTSYRSMFDPLNIPYIGTQAEIQGLLCDKWKTRGIM